MNDNSDKKILEELNLVLIDDLSKIIIEYIQPRLGDLKCDSCNIGDVEYPYHINIPGSHDIIHSIDCNKRDLRCNYCDAYYLICTKCTEIKKDNNGCLPTDLYPVVLCQFIGGHTDTPNYEEMISCVNGIGQFVPTKNMYLVAYKNIQYASVDELVEEFVDFSGLNGPYELSPTYWKCTKCQTYFDAII